MKLIQKDIKTGSNSKEPAEWQTAYYDYLYNFASYKVDDKELIKDLIQDTFLAAIQSRKSFQQKSSEITWLTAILKYKIYKNYRGRGKNTLVYISSLNLKDLSVCTTEDDKKLIDLFTDPLDLKDFEREIKAFIGTLPEKWQLVYNLKYFYNESAPVICEKLNLSESNYWVISHRLKTALREWYLTKWN
jgi:RNA polymerase sigma factor (sigma-70 family)